MKKSTTMSNFVVSHRELAQAFPNASGIYAGKIRYRFELTVRVVLIGYAAQMDAVFGRMVHRESISLAFSVCRLIETGFRNMIANGLLKRLGSGALRS
jgi:hypothetical protein